MTDSRSQPNPDEPSPPLYIRHYAVQLDDARKEIERLRKALETGRLYVQASVNAYTVTRNYEKALPAQADLDEIDAALSHRSAKT